MNECEELRRILAAGVAAAESGNSDGLRRVQESLAALIEEATRDDLKRIARRAMRCPLAPDFPAIAACFRAREADRAIACGDGPETRAFVSPVLGKAKKKAKKKTKKKTEKSAKKSAKKAVKRATTSAKGARPPRRRKTTRRPR